MNLKVCVISGSRAEYGLLRNIVFSLRNSKFFELQFLATGSHLSGEYGNTIDEIKRDNIVIDKAVSILSSNDTSLGVAESFANGVREISLALDELRPDMVMVLGDRYEIFASAIASMLLNIPISHIHGGEKGEGAFDEAIRHSITKMSYFHFVAAEDYKTRVIQLGEDPDRVFVVGGMGLDSIANAELLSRQELERRVNFKFEKPLIMVTFHPVTLDESLGQNQFKEMLEAIKEFPDLQFLFTLPNADTEGSVISEMIQKFVSLHSNALVFESLGHVEYLSCLKLASGVIGNSSSGLLEAPAFGIGTVNVGDRQKGRLRAKSVVDVDPIKNSIIKGIEKIFLEDFKSSIRNQINPYGEPGASKKIVKILEEKMRQENWCDLKKNFYDLI